jgi:hypothetical protein
MFLPSRVGAVVHADLFLLQALLLQLFVDSSFEINLILTYSRPFSVRNYGPNGFTAHYTLVEYLMGVMTEWLACVFSAPFIDPFLN